MIAHLKYKCLVTVLSLLEGQTGNYVITRMIRSLNLEILKENIISFYFSFVEMYPRDYYDHPLFNHFESNDKYNPNKKSNYENNPEYYQLIIEVGFMVYHLLCYFKDNEDPENKKIIKNELPDLVLKEENNNFFGTKLLSGLGKFGLNLLGAGLSAVSGIMKKKKIQALFTETEKAKILSEAYDFFQKNTGNIEVVFNDQVVRLYFWIRPEAHHITEEQKSHFHLYVDRTSAKAKVQYLLYKANNIIEEMTHEFKLAKLFKKSKFLALIASNVFIWKELAFSMTLVLNFIIISSYGNQPDRPGNPYWLYEDTGTLFYISIFGSIQMACSICIVLFFLMKTAPVLISRGWKKHSQTHESKSLLIRISRKLKNGFLATYYALTNINVLYQLTYLTFSILGTAVHPFFFAFQLLDVLYRYPALQNVIRSVMIPIKSIVLSFLLIVIVSYLFSIWSYMEFYSYFTDSGNKCDSLGLCFKTQLDQGLKNGGGIGDYLNQLHPAVNDLGRFFNDTLFYIIVVKIMLNILKGIIIDTFAFLRNENESNAEDMENRCFVCSLEKEYIEYCTSRPLRYHVTYEHNEWNYIRFINYLNYKDPHEKTGIESYLTELIEKNDCSWIPQYRALSIKKKTQQEENVFKAKIEEIERIYDGFDRDIKELKKKMSEYLERKNLINIA